MSAYFDKNQGITFVYSNIFELYKKAKESKLDSPFVATSAPRIKETARVIKKEAGQAEDQIKEFVVKELERNESKRNFPVPMGVREAEEKAQKLNMKPLGKLQKNLSELSDAHQKLRFLLQELESLTRKK